MSPCPSRANQSAGTDAPKRPAPPCRRASSDGLATPNLTARLRFPDCGSLTGLGGVFWVAGHIMSHSAPIAVSQPPIALLALVTAAAAQSTDAHAPRGIQTALCGLAPSRSQPRHDHGPFQAKKFPCSRRHMPPPCAQPLWIVVPIRPFYCRADCQAPNRRISM
jgi:hypothetical protein